MTSARCAACSKRSSKTRRASDVHAALQGRAPCAIEEITGEISLAKNRLWTPEFYARHSRHKHAPLIAAAWAELDEELENSNAASFDDLLCLAVRLLGEHPNLQQHYRARWRWLLVDEVQDTCYAQMGLLRLLAQPAGNLSICGDADQALYAFRGADPRNLLSFRALFPSRRTVTLAVNFRSYEEIVRRAEAVIANNRNREPIEFIAARGTGGHVIARACENEHAEAGWIAKEIARQIQNGVRPQQILVLARSAFAYAPVRKALERSGIAHHVLGSLGLFERGEVKTALAYLQLIQNPLDAIALRRAIQHPRREVGEKSCQAIVAHARARAHRPDRGVRPPSADPRASQTWSRQPRAVRRTDARDPGSPPAGRARQPHRQQRPCYRRRAGALPPVGSRTPAEAAGA